MENSPLDKLPQTPNNVSMWKYVFIFGGIGVIATFISFMIPMVGFFLNMFVSTIVLYFAITQFRKARGGGISFGEGYKIAFLTSLFKGLLFTLLCTILYTIYMTPESIELTKESIMTIYDEYEIEYEPEQIDAILKPSTISFTLLFLFFIGGALFSLVAAAFAQSDDE